MCFGVMDFVLNCYTLPVIKAKIMNFWALFWYCFCLFFSSCTFGGFLNTLGFLLFVSSISLQLISRTFNTAAVTVFTLL